MSRIDLSDWVMHFVHDRNPETNAAYNLNEGDEQPAFPYHADMEKNSRFELWEMVDEASGLAPDDSAFSVLLKIIENGHIRSGWSFRGNPAKPTIYGPRAACCFTEMPLYGLIDYAKKRNKDMVGTIAVGFLRNELFQAGGRPVIYGLSRSHKEIPVHSQDSFMGWPRYLDPSCGIAEHEQYRYVATNIGGTHYLDWTHEREWRWADTNDEYDCPGLPVWLKEQSAFSKVMVVVPTKKNAKQVLDLLKELYDAKFHNFDYEYNLKILRNTHVVALEDLNTNLSEEELKTLRIENIPSNHISLLQKPEASPKLIDEVRAAIEEATIAAKTAADERHKNAPRTKDGHIADVFGFANVVVYEAQSEVISALQHLGEVNALGGVGYRLTRFNSGSGPLTIAEASAEAAAKLLNERLPQVRFYVDSRWD